MREVKPDSRVKFLTPFDFESVMLYNGFTDSINYKAVIKSKVEGQQFPVFRSKGMSKYDKILLNKFYDCNRNVSRRIRRIVK